MKRTIGQTGIDVYAIGLGAMPLSLSGRPEESQGIKVIHAALDAGIDFIDTADVYCLDDQDIGHNERLIQKALKQRGNSQGIYVATKGGVRRPKGAWISDAHPSHLRQACEQSLKSLGAERIFLYQLHAPDKNVSLEDSLGELKNLQDEGKIAHMGLSNVSPEELKRARSLMRIESVQNHCNPGFQQDFHNGLIAECARQQVTYIPYCPVGGWRSHKELMEKGILRNLAQQYRLSPYQLALSWLLHKGDHIIPIPGASRVQSIEDSARAVEVKINQADIEKIDSWEN